MAAQTNAPQPAFESLTPVRFSSNWNGKLACAHFTTIRLLRPGKYKPGWLYRVECPALPHFAARLLRVDAVRYADIPDAMLYTDSGMDRPTLLGVLTKMYGADPHFNARAPEQNRFAVCLFRRENI